MFYNAHVIAWWFQPGHDYYPISFFDPVPYHLIFNEWFRDQQ